MVQARQRRFDDRVEAALDELRRMILKQYPGTAFEVERDQDEPENIHLTAIVDVDDTSEVLDLVIDRIVEIQVSERLPIHVIPIRTPERVLAARGERSGIH